MFWTYLFRELSNRRKQTAIIATGMALAIASSSSSTPSREA